MKNNNLTKIVIFALIFVAVVGVFAFFVNSSDLFNSFFDNKYFDSGAKENEMSDNQNDSFEGDVKVVRSFEFKYYLVDYIEEKLEYNNPLLYNTVVYSGKENSKASISLPDLSDQNYYPVSNMKQEYIFNHSTTVEVYYYESSGEISLENYTGEEATALISYNSIDLDEQCFVIKNELDYDVKKIIIRDVVLDYFSDYILEGFNIPSGGYLVLFPSLNKILGFEANGDTYNDYMTCSYNQIFNILREKNN